MFTHQFWFGDAGILVRSVRTFAQTAVAMIGVNTTSLYSVDFKAVVGTAGLAALLSALMSLDRSTAATAAINGTPAEPAAIPAPQAPQQIATFAPAVHGCGDDLR